MNRKAKPYKPNKGFFKPTLSIPAELQPFVKQRKNAPQHAGNLSSYVRSLIIADQKAHELKTA